MESNTQPNNRWKRFLSQVGAGVIGSALTLGVVTQTDLLPSAAGQQPALTENTPSYQLEQTSANATHTLSDMVEHASKAIVGITQYQNTGNRFAQDSKSIEAGTGSGVIYEIDDHYAYIVTNNHVVEGAEKLEVSFESGEKTIADLVGSDALSDLAVLKVDKKYADISLEFGDSGALRAGDPVIAIGNPLGLDFSRTVTQGIISAIDRSINVQTAAGEWEMNVIQTDAAINPGNSGGALLNAEGKIIGINTLKVRDSGIEGLGFAIPSNEVMPLLAEMTENGHIERPYIGVGLADLAQVPANYVRDLPESVKGGVMVVNIDPESAAAKAGIQEEDVITAMNGTEIMNAAELRKFLYTELKIGDLLTLTVYRGAELKTFELTLTGNKK